MSKIFIKYTISSTTKEQRSHSSQTTHITWLFLFFTVAEVLFEH